MAWRKIILLLLSLGAGYAVYLMCAPLEPAARITAGIMAVAVILWVTEWVPLFLTSFIILILLAAFLAVPGQWGRESAELFYEPFFSPVITLFLGGFALSRAMAKYRLDRMCAAWLMRSSGGHPMRLLTWLLTASAALSMWISNAAATLLMLTAALPIVQRLARPEDSKALLFAIPIGATFGGMLTPVGSPPNAVAAGLLSAYGHSLSFAGWFLYAAPLAVLLLGLTRLLLVILFPIRRPEPIRWDNQEPVPWTGSSIGVAAIFAVTVGLWLSGPLHGLDEGIVALIPCVLLFASGLLEPRDVKELGWDTLLLVGGGMSLGAAVHKSGLSELIVGGLAGLNTGLPFDSLLGATSLALSTFISDTVTATLLAPLAVSLGDGLLAAILMITMASSLALGLPVASPANAILFSTGRIRSWDMVKIGGLVSLIGFMALYLCSRLYWPLLGG